MKTRRGVLSAFSVMAASAVVPMARPVEAEETHVMKAGFLADLMRSRQGGDWGVKIDSKNEFILIFKKPKPQA